MESATNLTIALDAGHGGHDTGATAFSRREKDDNLRLALHTGRELAARGFTVRSTRTDDSFVPLSSRVSLAEQKEVDLLICLHRAAFPTPSDEALGFAGYIYPTASLETAGRAAQLVLAAIEEVGVSRIVGISRGNHPVLRRALMPAFLLEAGFITNNIDNQLFDQNISGYARAITKGVTGFFGLEFSEKTPKPFLLAEDDNEVLDMQKLLEARYGFGLRESGRFDTPTRRALVVALQIELNGSFSAGIPVSGNLCQKTLAAIRPVRPGETSGTVALLQAMLILNGYRPGDVDGNFGPHTGTALRFFQRDRYITPDGIAGVKTLLELIGH